MQKLTQNITNLYGDNGAKWISNLPNLVQTLSSHWGLNHIVPVDNMTFNFVAKAINNTNQPVILKISYDEESILNEKSALMYFNGDGSIKLIDYNDKYYAMLLQQGVPGITLKSIYPLQAEYVMDSYVNTMKKLHDKRIPENHNYSHISHWLKALDNLTSDQVPVSLLNKVIHLKDSLLESIGPPVLLHGDLHHDNILQNNNEWLAIDPKGIIGEPEFEIAAFDFMSVEELSNHSDVKNIFNQRIALLSYKSNLNTQRIKDWVIVRLLLMVAWSVEDNADPTAAIKLAKRLFRL